MRYIIKNIKNKTLFYAAIFLLFLMAIYVVSRLIPSSPVSDAAPDNYRMACIIPSRSETVFWEDIDSNIRKAASDFSVDITMIYTENNEGNMVIDLNDAIEIAILADTQAIITSYTKGDQTTESLLRRAREAGIFVVLLDCDGPKDIRDIYVGIDNEAAGYALGEYVLNHLPEGQKTLLTFSENTLERQNLTERVQGIQRAFQQDKDRFDILTFASWDDLRSTLEIEEYLQDNKNTGAIIATRERVTISCAQLIQRLGQNSAISVYGFDQSDETTALLNSNTIHALVCQQNDRMGYESVRAALSLIEGTAPESGLHLIDYFILFSE